MGGVRSIGIIRDSQDCIERPEIKRKEKDKERKGGNKFWTSQK